MTAFDLIVGSKVEYLNGQGDWEESTITMRTNNFIWFEFRGYEKILKVTFDNNPDLYRIVSI